MKRVSVLLLSLVLFAPACSNLDYNKTYWGAGSFHPQKIIVLPVSVGGHEMVQEEVEDILVKSLWGTGWYDKLVAPQEVKTKSSELPGFAKLLSDYVVKLNTLGDSDEYMATKIGKVYKAEAILITDMSSWGYGLIEGDKMAWLSLSMTLVDAKTGDIMWKAKHRVMEDYLLVQPGLRELCEELLGEMLTEMPH